MEEISRSKSKQKKKSVRPAKKRATAKGRAAAKTATKKMATNPKLTLKKFKTRRPKKLFRPRPDKAYLKNFVAPPFTRDKKAADRIRQILFRKFDAGQTAEAAPSPAPAAAVPSGASAPETPRPVPPAAPSVAKQPRPSRVTAALAGAGIFLMVLVVAASASNRGNYYLKTANGAVEVWRGRFAPIGRNRLLVLPGAQPPAAVKTVYSENEIKDFAFNYYIDRVDVLLEASEIPDFEGIKVYLQKALDFGVTPEQRRAALSRFNTIDMMIYLYKADVAASKGAQNGYQAALQYLQKADALEIDPAQKELVNKKIKAIEELMAAPPKKDVEPSESPAAAQ